jgi:ATP adenylyltransferase
MNESPFPHRENAENVGLERLWAPWRLSYLKGEASNDAPQLAPVNFLPFAAEDCFLCQGAGIPHADDTVAEDRKRLVVGRQKHTLTILNRYPYNNGHLLVCPRQHKANLEELTIEEYLEIFQAITRSTQLLTKLMQPAGFNIGLNLGRVAGAGVPGHLHWHVVPRWTGDANFMSVTADARVISQSLDELWCMLTSAMQDDK